MSADWSNSLLDMAFRKYVWEDNPGISSQSKYGYYNISKKLEKKNLFWDVSEI